MILSNNLAEKWLLSFVIIEGERHNQGFNQVLMVFFLPRGIVDIVHIESGKVFHLQCNTF